MRPIALVVVIATALAGCGGGGGGPPKEPEDVIEAWSAAMRAGDGRKAADYFTVPAIVQNGGPPLTLSTRPEIVFFNVTLPCGGRVVRTSQRGAYTDVIFVLTDRPGGSCGSGTGHEVATAFLVRDGKIAEWRRLPDPPRAGTPQRTPSPPTVTGPRA
jgi:hypothetical protein